MTILYNLIVRTYILIIRIASLFNEKAKLWIKGRKGIFKIIESSLDRNKKLAWFHCASLGEFEQARPVIETFRNENKNFAVLLTFFSPSGYEIRKKYTYADYIYYLPADTKRNAKRFINIVNPDIVFFVKYEFWYNYLHQLHLNNIPTILFSSVFRKNQIFFKSYGKWNRKVLSYYKHIFVQDEMSEKLLASIGIKNVTIAGDTRFDRVNEITKFGFNDPVIEKFCKEDKIIICGSTWSPDEELIKRFIPESGEDIKFIIAPHEIHKSNIERILSEFGNEAFCYSSAEKIDFLGKKVLIIDNIGLLSSIYRYGKIAFVGGGFKTGLHNILEPAAYGLPVVFGPEYKKFHEAILMINEKAAFSICSYETLIEVLQNLLYDNSYYEKTSFKARNFVLSNLGSTRLILDFTNIII